MSDIRIHRDPEQKYFEDFVVGDVIETRGRTIDVADISAFAGLTGDHYPLHTDAEYAAETQFGSRIAHGPLTFSIAVGLVGMTGYYGDAIVALVEITSMRALKPVHPGDTLRVRAEVIDATGREGSRFGSVGVMYSVLNQRQEEVMTFTQSMLARRRPARGDDE
jgi:3-hydroxybutyryl-CoA dehydratase